MFKLSFPLSSCSMLCFGESIFFFFLSDIYATACIALLKPDSQEPHQTEHCRTSTFSALTLAKRQLVQSKPAVVNIRM